MSDTDMKKLSDMRVVELRAELEKRGLDRSGNKQTLLDRLQKYFNENADEQKDERPEEPKGEDEAPEEQKDDVELSQKSTEVATSTNCDTKAVEDNNPEETKVTNELKETKEVDRELKDDTGGDGETFIRLTLEDEEAAFQEDETDSLEKSAMDAEPSSDTKNGNIIEAEPSKANQDNNKARPQQAQQREEKSTREQSSSDGKTSSKSKKLAYSQSRNLWITNISKATRATELKQALSAYGKVIGAKVVINARFPGTCCYGYVTMDTVEDADNCMAKLNNTELNGQIIKIEKVRPDHMNPLQQQRKHSESNKDKDRAKDRRQDRSTDQKKEEDGNKEDKDKEPKITDEKSTEDKKDDTTENGTHKARSEKRSHSPGRSRERSRNSDAQVRERSLSSKSKRERREREILTFDKIKEERERQRLREQERVLREEARRRREEAARQREIERRQRTEAQRLEREREKLRQEREKLEREKDQLIRLERERQKLEREKLELEKLELQRAKIRMQEEDRRALKRTAPYRRDESYEDRKRSATDRHFDEAPPPPRFDPPSTIKIMEPGSPKKISMSSKDMKSRFGFDKRESYSSSKRDRDYETERPNSLARPPPTSISKYENANVFNLGRDRDSPSGMRMPKERYERKRSPHYRQLRDDIDRRGMDKPEMRSTRDHRYSDGPKDPVRFERNSSSSWGDPSSPRKSFVASNIVAPNKTWVKETWRPNEVSSSSGERWGSSNSRGGSISGPGFSSSASMSIGPTCPPPPGLNNYPTDRFDYKTLGSNMRKY